MKCQKSKIFEHPKNSKNFRNSENKVFRVVRNQRFRTKAQGISMNMIVIAIVALVALIIIALAFNGRISNTSQGFSACENKQGVCQQGSCKEGFNQLDFKCPENYVCCIQGMDLV